MNRRRRRRKRRRNDILYALIALSCAALVLVAIAIIDVVQSGDDAITVEFQNYDSPSRQVDEKTFSTKGAAQVSTDGKEHRFGIFGIDQQAKSKYKYGETG